jgi:hypothetical protein
MQAAAFGIPDARNSVFRDNGLHLGQTRLNLSVFEAFFINTVALAR